MDIREVLAEGNLALWERLADEIAARYEVVVVEPPATGLVMLQAKDSVAETPFYLGEVLITRATVTINGVVGYGLTLEEEGVRAICMAVLDAALAASLPESEGILAAVAGEDRRLMELRTAEEHFLAGSKVHFAIMEG